MKRSPVINTSVILNPPFVLMKLVLNMRRAVGLNHMRFTARSYLAGSPYHRQGLLSNLGIV